MNLLILVLAIHLRLRIVKELQMADEEKDPLTEEKRQPLPVFSNQVRHPNPRFLYECEDRVKMYPGLEESHVHLCRAMTEETGHTVGINAATCAPGYRPFRRDRGFEGRPLRPT